MPKTKKDLKNSFNFDLQELVKLMPGHVYWKDRRGYYLGSNAAQLDVWGLTAEEARKKGDILEYNGTEEEAEIIRANDEEVMSKGVEITAEEPLTTKEGEKIIYLSRKAPIYDEQNNIVGLIGVSIDITDAVIERKKIEKELKEAKEQAEHLNYIKTEFLGNMSHDVRTPLSGILGLTNQILASTEERETYEFVQDIRRSAQSLFSFFDNCLELSKFENADVTLISESFSLENLIYEVVALFTPAAKAKKIDINVHCDERLPPFLHGSKPTLFRIIQNLIGNAVKFTKEGAINIVVSLGEKSTNRNAIVKIAVEDTGVGIPKDKQKIIFDKLTRLTSSNEGIYEGSGIGLYLVKKFVDKLGGEIHVHSEENKGTKFLIVLSLQVPLLSEKEFTEIMQDSLDKKEIFSVNEPKKVLRPVKRKKTTTTSPSHFKFLLVEDNDIAQKTAKIMLEDMAHKVDLAENSAQAIELFKANKYDIVLTDIGLHDIDGYKLTEILREFEKETHATPTPILALTAHASYDISNKAKASGINFILSKPLLREQVDTAIAQFIYKETANDLPLEKPDTDAQDHHHPQKKVIDLVEGARILGKNEETAKKFLFELIESLEEYRQKLDKAFRSGSFKKLADTIHQFYGGLCYVGTPCLRKAAKELEQALSSNTTHHQVTFHYQKLLDELSAVEKEFEKSYANALNRD